MSRKKHRPSPESHRPLTVGEQVGKRESFRRAAVYTNIAYIRSTYGILKLASRQGFLEEEPDAALQDWEERNLIDLSPDILADIGDARLSRRERRVIKKSSDEKLAYLCKRSGEMAIELAIIAPAALVNDLDMQVTLERQEVVPIT